MSVLIAYVSIIYIRRVMREEPTTAFMAPYCSVYDDAAHEMTTVVARGRLQAYRIECHTTSHTTNKSRQS